MDGPATSRIGPTSNRTNKWAETGHEPNNTGPIPSNLAHRSVIKAWNMRYGRVGGIPPQDLEYELIKANHRTPKK